MKNITITLDEQIAAWVRMAAAKRKMSVSRLIGDLLHDRMSEARDQAFDKCTFAERTFPRKRAVRHTYLLLN